MGLAKWRQMREANGSIVAQFAIPVAVTKRCLNRTRLIKSLGTSLQSPDDIAALLNTRLGPAFERLGMEFKAQVIHAARNVQAMLPTTLALSGAYKTRLDIEAPHSFVFVPRGWLSAPLQKVVQQGAPFTNAQGRYDVVCLVKQWMSDEGLSQPPLLTYPEQMRADAYNFFASLNSPYQVLQRIRLTPERVVELKTLGEFLARYGDTYTRGAKYLLDLCSEAKVPRTVPDLEFLRIPRSFATLRPEVKDAAVPSVMIPWTLKATYSRATSSAFKAARS
jgi:hypothetical protein